MHENNSELMGALMGLAGFLNSPRQDEVLLKAAGVQLDRALFPLLVRVGRLGPISVADLAEHVGRDPSTVSRQVAKLVGLRLVERVEGPDRRTRATAITPKGARVMDALSAAREAMLDRVFASWKPKEREALARLNKRFVDGLRAYAQPLDQGSAREIGNHRDRAIAPDRPGALTPLLRNRG